MTPSRHFYRTVSSMVRAPRSHRGGYRSESYTVHMSKEVLFFLFIIALILFFSLQELVSGGFLASLRDVVRVLLK